jgi:phage/plasmid-like protein (TIGR03299 family)
MNDASILTPELKEEMLNRAGLNWKVVSEPIQTVSGILIPNRVALVREDTQYPLGVHTDTYEPYQNDELLELLYRIQQQTGLNFHTGGSFKNGMKVWFQLKSNDLRLGNDKIEGYVSGFNSFDGSTALAFGNSSITVSCQNTFWRGYREVTNRLRHSSTMREKIEEILSRIDLVMKEEQTMFKEITRLSEIRMTPEVQELITKKLFEFEVEDRLDDPKLSTRMKNKILTFNADLSMEVAEKGDNLWGLFSGITRYTTHDMKKDKDNSEAKMFGRIGTVERKIYHELVDLAVV